MIQHYWTVLIKKSNIDDETKALILGEVLEEVQLSMPMQLKEKFEQDIIADGMVSLPFDYELVSYIGSNKPNTKVKLQMELSLPNGKPTKPVLVDIDFGDKIRMRSRMRSNILTISGSGLHLFKMYEILGDERKLLAELPLNITVNFV